MNANGYVFVAAVIARNEWTSDICLVGHENTVEVASYNPHIFLRDPTLSPPSPSPESTSTPISSNNICSVVALGADDLSVSIWQTKSPRPLIVAKDAFEAQIFDLSWASSGLTLYACSADGSLGVFDFDREELDGIVSVDKKEEYLKGFGFTIPTGVEPLYSGGGAQPLQSQQTPALSAAQQAAAAAAMDPGPAFDKKGRRRIKPLFVSALNSGGSAASLGGAPGGAGVTPAPYVPGQVPPFGGQYNPSLVNGAGSSHGSVGGPAYGFAQAPQRPQHPHANGISGDPGMGISWDSNAFASNKRKADEMTPDVEEIVPYQQHQTSTSRVRGRTLGGDRPRESISGPVRELRGPATTMDVEVRGVPVVLGVPPRLSHLTIRVPGEEGDIWEGRNFEDEQSMSRWLLPSASMSLMYCCRIKRTRIFDV